MLLLHLQRSVVQKKTLFSNIMNIVSLGEIIKERAGKQFESTGAKTAFVHAGASVACCFTLSVCLMNRFFHTAFLVALSIRELLSDRAVTVFLMICVHVFVRSFACDFGQ